MTETIIPHSDYGGGDCCGCLTGVTEGPIGKLVCNECGTLVKLVAADDLQKTIAEMYASMECTTATCPHCHKRNAFPGFSKISAYVCHECGRAVTAVE